MDLPYQYPHNDVREPPGHHIRSNSESIGSAIAGSVPHHTRNSVHSAEANASSMLFEDLQALSVDPSRKNSIVSNAPSKSRNSSLASRACNDTLATVDKGEVCIGGESMLGRSSDYKNRGWPVPTMESVTLRTKEDEGIEHDEDPGNRIASKYQAFNDALCAAVTVLHAKTAEEEPNPYLEEGEANIVLSASAEIALKRASGELMRAVEVAETLPADAPGVDAQVHSLNLAHFSFRFPAQQHIV